MHLKTFNFLSNQLWAGAPHRFILVVLTDLEPILWGHGAQKSLVSYNAAPLLGLREDYGYGSQEPSGVIRPVLQHNNMVCVYKDPKMANVGKWRKQDDELQQSKKTKRFVQSGAPHSLKNSVKPCFCRSFHVILTTNLILLIRA